MVTPDTVQQRSWERTYNVELDNATKQSLWNCMAQERLYHNRLVTELNSKLRVLASEIVAIKDQHEKIWGAVAQSSVNLRTLLRKPAEEWPDALRPYHDAVIKDGKVALSDKALLIYDIPAYEASLHPQMRKAIALEILKWVQPQAKTMLNSLTNTTGQMSTPLQMLQPLEPENKRHVQLLGTLASITYDDAEKASTIRIPYSTKDIIIQNQDLTKTPHDNIIIRQNIKQALDVNAPWQITIKEGKGKYMLDLIDATLYKKNPGRKR